MRRSSRKSKESEHTPIVIRPTKLIETETNATGSVDFGVYLRYFRSIGVPFSVTIVAMNAVNQGISVSSNYWLTAWTTDPRAVNETFWRNFYVGGYGGLGLIQGKFRV